MSDDEEPEACMTGTLVNEDKVSSIGVKCCLSSRAQCQMRLSTIGPLSAVG